MDQIKLTKNNVIKALNSSDNFKEELNAFFKNTLKINTAPEEIKNTYLFRKEQINEFLRGLNNPKQNLYLLGGFQGTGKTTFIKALSLAFETNILFFHYECSNISNLDDIILSLHSYLQQFSFKDSKNIRSGKVNPAVDEQLMAILNVIDRPLIIVLDGFENILKEHSDIRDLELKKFLDFILSINQAKLILSGKKIPILSFKNSQEPIFTIRLSGLEKEDALKILTDFKINTSNDVLNQAFEDTRGYPESLKLLATTSNLLKISVADILQEYANFDDSFESFTFQKTYNHIPEHCKEIVNFFTIIRHPISLSVLKSLNLFNDINDLEETIDYLVSILILTENNKEYYIKDFFKNIIYSDIADIDKTKLHHFLNDLYKDQIEKQLKNRILNISKNLLYSEKYYHYNIINRIKKKQKPDMGQPNPILMSSYFNNKFDLSYFRKNSSENNNSEKQKEKAQPVTQNPVVKTTYESIGITFSEDEKNLLEIEDDDEIIFEGQLIKEEKQNEQKQDNSNNDRTFEPNIFEDKSSVDLKNEYLKTAQTFEDQEKYEMAINYYKKASDLLMDTKEYSTVAQLTMKIVDLYTKSNKPDNSIEYLLKALGLYTNMNDRHNIVMTIYRIADSYNQRYKHETALKYFYILLNTECPVPECIENKTLIGIGEIYNYRKDYNLALKFYLKAFSKIKYYDDIETKCALCFKLALIYDDMNNFEKALYFYNKNLEISKDSKLNQFLSSAYSNIAIIHEDSNQKEKALKYYTKSLEVDKELNFYEGQYKTLSILSNIYFEQGDQQSTIKCLMEGIHAAKKSGDDYCIAMSFLDIGDFYLSQKIYPKAIMAFIKAKKAIGQVISTDSKEKIDRRFKQIIMEIGEKKFNYILESFRKKNEQ